jgi:cytochrome c-type biogenesis protein CcmH
MTAPGPLLPMWGRRSTSSRLVLAASLLAALALTVLPTGASAVGAAPRTSIADVEDEVMCPICGTLLELAQSPQAQRQRVLVRRLIAEGRTKAEIKDALVAEYGREVLALPRGTGFDLTAYLVPAIAFVAALVGLGLGVMRWRRAGRSAGAGDPREPGGPGDEDAERLEADLARYDL